MPPVAGLLLAAGAGRRFGGPKALVTLPDGTGLLPHAVHTLHRGGCDPVVVVVGAAADQARTRLPPDVDVRVVVNPDWPTGMGSSLRCGLAALGPTVDAAVVLLVDTPGIGSAAVTRLAAVAGPEVVAIATYGGQRGHPVLLGRTHWPDVARLAVGDEGARPFLRTYDGPVREVPCDDVAVPGDIDRPEDLAAD